MYTVEYSLSIRKEEILLFVPAQMDLDSIVLGKISQMERDKNYMISYNFKWNIKHKATNVNTKQTNRHRQHYGDCHSDCGI